MSVLWAAPYNLALGADIEAKVKAINSIGESAYSPQTSSAHTAATVETVPGTMAIPTRGSLTSSSQVHIEWAQMTTQAETGDSAITSYVLYWDQGTGNDVDFTEVIGETSSYLSQTYTIDSGITTLTSYRFKVAAKNKWGQGVFSPILTIIAYRTSDPPNKPVITVDGTDVVISWNKPDASVTEYEIMIETSVDDTFNEHTNCQGDDSTIVANLKCKVPMADLTQAPYSLSLGDLIVAKVRANNPIGWSLFSDENTSGATVQTKPATMNPVTRGSETNLVQIEVDWSPLTLAAQTGGSAITSYWL